MMDNVYKKIKEIENLPNEEDRAIQFEHLLRELESVETLAEGNLRFIARRLQTPQLDMKLAKHYADTEQYALGYIPKLLAAFNNETGAEPKVIEPFKSIERIVSIEFNDHLTWLASPVALAWPCIKVRVFAKAPSDLFSKNPTTFWLASSLLEYSKQAYEKLKEVNAHNEYTESELSII